MIAGLEGRLPAARLLAATTKRHARSMSQSPSAHAVATAPTTRSGRHASRTATSAGRATSETRPARRSPPTLPPRVAVLVVLALLLTACGKQAASPAPATPPLPQAQAAAPAQAPAQAKGSVQPPPRAEASAPTQAAANASARPWWPATSLAAPSPAGPFDGLVRIDAPQFGARSLDDALRPTIAALQSLPGVVHVASAARHGGARIVVRFADDVTAAKAATTLDAGIDGAGSAALGRLQRGLIPRGARTMTAISWVGATDALSTTAWAESTLLPVLLRQPGTATAELVGATRPVVDLHVQPPAMPRFGVTIGELVQATRRAIEAAPAGADLDAVLTGTTLPRHRQPNGASTPPTLADLVTTGRGEGDDTQRAWIGSRAVLVAKATGNAAKLTNEMQTARVALERDLAGLRRPGDESFVHSLHAMARYRVRVAPDRTAEAPEALARRLHQVLVDGQAHDALLVEGIDGIPCALDAHCHEGRVFTLWIASSGGRERPGALQILQGTLEPGGWQVHALHDRWDTATGWLIDDDATFAVLTAGRDGGETSAVARSITERLVRSPTFASVRAGLKPMTPRGAAAMVAQEAVATKGVAAGDLALAVALLGGTVPVGTLKGAQIRMALPPGVMAAEHGRMLLATRDDTTQLASLLQTPGTSPEPGLLRLDGRPALYTAADSAGEASWVLAEHGHQDVERVVEPNGELSVLPLILGQAALSTRGGR